MENRKTKKWLVTILAVDLKSKAKKILSIEIELLEEIENPVSWYTWMTSTKKGKKEQKKEGIFVKALLNFWEV